jgi:hypothetical protein
MKHCDYKNCTNPNWARGRCKWHQKPKETVKKKSVPDKKLARLAEYRNKRDAFLAKNHTCMIDNCTLPSELHHARGRLGNNLTDESTFRNLCRKHHAYYELHPIEAKELGISLNRL